MKDQVTPVIDRLRSAQVSTWRRVVIDARLSDPVDMEPEAAAVTAPYRWLLDRVGSGIRLTSAGYLPPAIVTEAMDELGWRDDWIGKGNREDLTQPVLELRESAQWLGLLRKHRGQLLTTKLGVSLATDPNRLWRHVVDQLPQGRSEPEHEAGVLYLLTVAARRPRSHELMALGMAVLGWADRETGEPMNQYAAMNLARRTEVVLDRVGVLPRRIRWDLPEPAPTERGVRLARAALIGIDPVGTT